MLIDSITSKVSETLSSSIQAKGFDTADSINSQSSFGALNESALENKLHNQLSQKAVAQGFTQWLEQKSEVVSYLVILE